MRSYVQRMISKYRPWESQYRYFKIRKKFINLYGFIPENIVWFYYFKNFTATQCSAIRLRVPLPQFPKLGAGKEEWIKFGDDLNTIAIKQSEETLKAIYGSKRDVASLKVRFKLRVILNILFVISFTTFFIFLIVLVLLYTVKNIK